MDHHDHVALLRGGVPAGPAGGLPWADLGSGGGAFTLALADLLGEAAEIYSIDKDRQALREQERQMRLRFPAARVHYIAADFTRALDLPQLSGVVMANSLHYQRHPQPVVQAVREKLAPGGRLLVVEYNIDHGNFAVPHPISFTHWQQIAARAGFAATELLATRPSRFLREIYSAVSRVAEAPPAG